MKISVQCSLAAFLISAIKSQVPRMSATVFTVSAITSLVFSSAALASTEAVELVSFRQCRRLCRRSRPLFSRRQHCPQLRQHSCFCFRQRRRFR
uniref:Putative secreted protein n=1 Tax=Ixodes ricinus TaxID=34613 RepID=A0A147BP93_IXORI